MDFPGLLPTSGRLSSLYGVSAGKRDQIDKKFFFEIINVLDQMIKSTSILLKNFFLKKISIWSLFPALTPYYFITLITCLYAFLITSFEDHLCTFYLYVDFKVHKLIFWSH